MLQFYVPFLKLIKPPGRFVDIPLQTHKLSALFAVSHVHMFACMEVGASESWDIPTANLPLNENSAS